MFWYWDYFRSCFVFDPYSDDSQYQDQTANEKSPCCLSWVSLQIKITDEV